MEYSPLFHTVARQHRIYCDADPDGSAGGWSATKVQMYVPLIITQAEADLIISTQGNVGVLLMMAAPTEVA